MGARGGGNGGKGGSKVRRACRGGLLCKLFALALGWRDLSCATLAGSCPRLQPCFIGFCRVGVLQGHPFHVPSAGFCL